MQSETPPGDLVLYTHPMSHGRTARGMLEDSGGPFRTELLEYGTTSKAPAFLAINPVDKVPTLTHGNVLVSQAAAICACLADAFSTAGLAPAGLGCDPRSRWLVFAGRLKPAVLDRVLELSVPNGRKGMVANGSLEDALDVPEAAVAGRKYLAVSCFSAADAGLGGLANLSMVFGIVQPRPAFRAYCDGLLARPAARRASGIDDALMPSRPAGGP